MEFEKIIDRTFLILAEMLCVYLSYWLTKYTVEKEHTQRSPVTKVDRIAAYFTINICGILLFILTMSSKSFTYPALVILMYSASLIGSKKAFKIEQEEYERHKREEGKEYEREREEYFKNLNHPT